MDCSPPGSSVHGILQAKTLEFGLLFPSPGDSSQPRDWTCVSCIAGGFFASEPPGKPSSHHRSPWIQRASLGWLVATGMSERSQGWEGFSALLLLLWIWRRSARGEVQRLRVDPGLEPAGKRKSQSCDCKKMNSASNLNRLEAHSPSTPSDRTGLASTLIWDLEGSEHETQLTLYPSFWPEGLGVDKRVPFSLTKIHVYVITESLGYTYETSTAL